jgi:hypothetical protein
MYLLTAHVDEEASSNGYDEENVMQLDLNYIRLFFKN